MSYVNINHHRVPTHTGKPGKLHKNEIDLPDTGNILEFWYRYLNFVYLKNYTGNIHEFWNWGSILKEI